MIMCIGKSKNTSASGCRFCPFVSDILTSAPDERKIIKTILGFPIGLVLGFGIYLYL